MISARNKIKGTIIDINEGAVNGIVKLETKGGNRVSATISMESIRDLQLKKGQYRLTEGARAAVGDYIKAANTSSIAFGNARGVRNIFERLLVAQANRLAQNGDVTKEDLMDITEEDVAAARTSDEKMLAAEKARDELVKSAEETIAELQELSKNVKVQLDGPEESESDEMD